MSNIIIIRKKSLWKSLQSRLLYYRLQLQTSFTHFYTGLRMLITGDTRWYYDYRSQKVLILTGLDYWRSIRVDLGEVAYLNVKDKSGKTVTTRAELF
jgi:hypothetical protein